MAVYEQRGSAQQIEDLIREDQNNNSYNLFDTKNAISIIKDAIKQNEEITIVGDYDCDGVCATSIMALTIKELGGKPKMRLPLRFSEGYGMKPVMVDEINTGLVITVDNGITAFEAVKAAKEKGLTVLVTDHHTVNFEIIDSFEGGYYHTINRPILPDADCIINPHLEEFLNDKNSYDYYDYCGAGIAYKLAEKLLGNEHPLMDKLSSFAALATVADVMPITGDNKNIVKRGIMALADDKTTRGLSALIAANKIDVSNMPKDILPWAVITNDVLGFSIAPCINATSRLHDDGAYTALRCVLSENIVKARQRTDMLIECNDKRKEVTKTEMALVNKIISENNMKDDCPLVVHLPDSGPGIIGLHAGSLCEQYRVPVIVINGHGDMCKGSCRAPEGVNIKHLLDATKEYLEGYGGHAGAAGLTIKETNINAFRERLQEICKEKGIVSKKSNKIQFDLAIDASEIPDILNTMIKKMSPFGEGNTEPTFLIKNFDYLSADILSGGHLRLVSDKVSAIGFNMTDIPKRIDGLGYTLYGSLSYNCFRGEAKPQIIIKGVVKSGDEIIYKTDKGDNIKLCVGEDEKLSNSLTNSSKKSRLENDVER